MTGAQVVFLIGLLAVLSAVAAFSGIVVTSAARGGRAIALGRMGRAPEHSSLGRAAFLAHRISGFAIFAFLCLHVLDVGLYSVSVALYDEVHALYGTAPMRVFESGLLFAILFHAGNGLRVLAVDLVPLSAAWAQRLLHVVVALSLVGGTAGTALILAPIFR